MREVVIITDSEQKKYKFDEILSINFTRGHGCIKHKEALTCCRLNDAPTCEEYFTIEIEVLISVVEGPPEVETITVMPYYCACDFSFREYFQEIGDRAKYFFDEDSFIFDFRYKKKDFFRIQLKTGICENLFCAREAKYYSVTDDSLKEICEKCYERKYT